MKNAHPWFYGWTIVALTFAIQFLVMGSGYYIFGVLLKPLSDALETSRFVISLALTGQIVMSAVLGPWLGRAVGERSIKVLMTAGFALLSLGLMAISLAETVWAFYLAFTLLISTGFALAGPIPNAALIANWFSRKRGSAMGISQFGVTLSGAVLVPVFTWLMLSFNWQTALQLFALVVPLLALPVIWLGVVKAPADRGTHPDGIDAEDERSSQPEPEDQDWTLSRAIRTPTVWRLALVMGPGFMGISAVLLSLHSHLTDAGMTAMRASSLVAGMTLAGAIAKPTFGILSDYFDKRGVTLVSIGFMFAGVAGLISSEHYPLLMLSAVSFGLGYGAQMPLFNILIATLFGPTAFARMVGIMGPIMLPFNLIGLPLSTLTYETFGSYIPAYAAILVLYLVAIAGLWGLKLPKHSR